jgi:hypothetical protein
MAEENDNGHPIGELLAAPVRAIQEAQIAAEREFVQFFVDYGLEQVERVDGRTRTVAWRVRNIEFEMSRPIPDPTNPGAVIERTAVVTAPLLAMVNLPSVAIDEATINLSLDVVAESASTSQAARAAAATGATARPAAAAAVRSALPQARQAPVQLRGQIGRPTLASSLQARGRLEVTIKLVGSRDQEVLGRLTNLVTESLSARIEDKA